MLTLIGIVMVVAAVLGGFLLERGNPWVLFQPAELLIIGGSALGIVLISNSPAVIRKMALGLASVFRPRVYDAEAYLRQLRMLYEIFVFAQRAGGTTDLENHIENPDSSSIFSRRPEFLRDRETRAFVCDTLRMIVIGVTTWHELSELMDVDIEVQRRGRFEPVNALHSVAEALPGLGIVAAVLGVVITMGAIGGSPETIGEKVAAALVGTFLGILLCYGVIGPLAARLEHMSEAHSQLLQVLRIAIVAFARGSSAVLAVEYARRSIPLEIRPTFEVMEKAIRAPVPELETRDAAAQRA